MSRVSRATLATGYILALAVLAVDAVLVAASLRTITRNNVLHDQSRRLIDGLDGALAALRDAETGQRGYLLTGRDDYLEPFRIAEAAFEDGLARLGSFRSADAVLAARVAELRQAVAEKMAELRQTIALRREKGPEAARAVVLSDRGKESMDRSRRLAVEIRGQEDRRLSERVAESRGAVRNTIVTFVATSVMALALLIAVGYLHRLDLIERDRAAEAIHQERAWLATTLSSIGDAVIATDERGRVKFLNPVAEALTGWSQAEAAGRPMGEVFRIVNEQTRRPAENPVDQVLREGRVVGLANHTVLIGRDGTEWPIDDSAAPICGPLGQILGVVMVFHDVAEKRGRERAILASEALKGAILESALDSIITMDGRGHAVEFNPAAEAMFGYRRDEALGRTIEELIIPPELRESHRRGLARFHETGEGPVLGRRIEIEAQRADGSRFPVELAIVPIRQGDERLFTAYLRDMTERKRHEAERESLPAAERAARAEAEEADRAKAQFLAVLSHELRTPLNPILLAVTAMLERPTSVDDLRPNLEMIKRYVGLEARLIDDLLDVMRIVRGKMPLHWEVADAHALIHEAVQICRSEVIGNELRLDLHLEAARHHINADPARLQQVLWNLLKNAVKFTPAGGGVAVRTRNEAVGDGERLIIEVADTGIGIEPEVLPVIFDPFQQGESTITRRFGGLGLGLAISKGIVEGHGGAIRVESRGRDGGTTFVIELAALPAPHVDGPAGAGATRVARAESKPLRILLVEDEQATSRLLAKLLGGLGHEVATAGTIAGALGAELDGAFDLIISDIGLPDGSGLELMRQVVARRGPVPAIALTGYGMEEDIQRSRTAGFTAHMTKPIDFTKLEAMIRQVSP